MAQSTSIIPGSTVDERFSLVRPLGRGSMGSVWLARHLALDIDVAIKFIDSSLTKEANYVERFRREARAAAQLKGPHVVQVLDYGMDQHGRPFMAMELLEGMTLGGLLDERGPLSLEVTARVIAHAARGLTKAHALGIVHRDIKPENLFLCGDGEDGGFVLKVVDFGVARAGTASGQGTLSGQLIGSPVYMSPEQARGYRSIDSRADLFSLAVVAYQCITGTLPFSGDGLGEVLLAICTVEPEPPSQLVEGVPPSVDAWFAKALSKKPHGRFASAQEMSIAFEAAWGGELTSSRVSISRTSKCDLVQSTDGSKSEPLDSKSSQKRTAIPGATIGRSTSATNSARAFRVQPNGIADAVSPLTNVPHTRGVALLDHNDECLLVRGIENDAGLYSAIATHARTVGETVESIDGAADPTHLSVRFDNASVYVRWIGPFTLVVLGDDELRALLLTVGSNKLADRLAAFTEQLGGVGPAANLLRESGVGLPLTGVRTRISGPADPVTSPVDDGSRSGKLCPPDEEFELPIRRLWGFKKSENRKKGARNREGTVPRSPAAKRRLSPDPDVVDRSQLAPPHPNLIDCHVKKNRVRVYRGKVVGGVDESPPEPKRKRKVRVYRGRVIDEK